MIVKRRFFKMIRIRIENRNIYSVKEAFNCRSAYIFINYFAWFWLLSSNLHVGVQVQWNHPFLIDAFIFHGIQHSSQRKTNFHVRYVFAYYLCLFAVIGIIIIRFFSLLLGFMVLLRSILFLCVVVQGNFTFNCCLLNEYCRVVFLKHSGSEITSNANVLQSKWKYLRHCE